MYYNYTQIMVDEYKDINILGTVYDKENIEVKDSLFNPSKNFEIINNPFTFIIREKSSSYKRKKITDSISSFASMGILFIVSPKAQEVLKKVAKNNLEFYDVTIKGESIELTDYKFAKVVNNIDCVNVEKSNVKIKRNQLKSIKSLVFDEEKIPNDVKIFSIPNVMLEIFFHQDVKDAIEKEGLTGFQMRPINDLMIL